MNPLSEAVASPELAAPPSRVAGRIDRRVGLWHAPAVIAENNFIYKSLSNWAFNVAVGCSHACRFCYVPSVATIKQAAKLAEYGVEDPDAEWGDYVLLRPWDEQKFLASLRSAENTPRSQLKPDGNRAVIYCSTTDPYQVDSAPEPGASARTGRTRPIPCPPLARTDPRSFHTECSHSHTEPAGTG